MPQKKFQPAIATEFSIAFVEATLPAHAISCARLCLSLAQEIARAHGNGLRLETTTAGQTSFTLSLPTQRSAIAQN